MSNPKTMYYASVGPLLNMFDVDVDGAQLRERGAVTLPANIQYAWPHPSRRYLYQRATCDRMASQRRCPRGQFMPVSIAAVVIC
jgi:hypothetical protein